MKTVMQCETCKGTYAPIGADNVPYFHACPPIVDPVTLAVTPRPDARDENIRVMGYDDKGAIREMKAAGKGASVVT